VEIVVTVRVVLTILTIGGVIKLWSVLEMSKEIIMGIETKVSEILDINKIIVKGHPIKDEDIKKAWEIGFSDGEIAKQYGCHKTFISFKRYEMGLVANYEPPKHLKKLVIDEDFFRSLSKIKKSKSEYRHRYYLKNKRLKNERN
jgi:hypothetical protein